jgi:hypothetical protein
MDTKICNQLNNMYTQFDNLVNDETIIYDDKYKDELIEIYTNLYNTEQKYINSKCSKVINKYLETGSAEYEKYKLLNDDSLTLQHDQYHYNIYKVTSILFSIGLIYLMQ